MSQNVYQFIDLQRVDPPKKPLKIRKIEFVEIYEPFSEGQAQPDGLVRGNGLGLAKETAEDP